jgi:hypothetical protein
MARSSSTRRLIRSFSVLVDSLPRKLCQDLGISTWRTLCRNNDHGREPVPYRMAARPSCGGSLFKRHSLSGQLVETRKIAPIRPAADHASCIRPKVLDHCFKQHMAARMGRAQAIIGEFGYIDQSAIAIGKFHASIRVGEFPLISYRTKVGLAHCSWPFAVPAHPCSGTATL